MTSRTGPAGGLSAEWQHLSGKNRRVLDSVFLQFTVQVTRYRPGGRRDDGSSIQNRGKLRVCPRTNPQFARLTSGSHQTWNWVIGSPTAGQWVIWVIFHFRVTGSSFWPGVRPEFFRFSKKMPKMQNVHLKWWNDKSHCQVSVVGLKSLDVSPCNELLLLPMIIKNSLAWENFFTHKSTFGVHYRTGSLGQLGLRVAGFPGHWVAGSQNVTQFHLWFARLASGG